MAKRGVLDIFNIFYFVCMQKKCIFASELCVQR